jgi:hypothetical protein
MGNDISSIHFTEILLQTSSLTIPESHPDFQHVNVNKLYFIGLLI